MALDENKKLAYFMGNGFAAATITQNADMVVDPTKTIYSVEALMSPTKETDLIDNSTQIEAYRITETRKNSSSNIIAVIKTLTETKPSWLNDTIGYQEFTSAADPSSSAAQAYTFKITVNGIAVDSGSDISVTLGATAALDDIAIAIADAVNIFETDPVISVEVNVDSGQIRVSSLISGDTSTIFIDEPTAGSSLISLLTSVDPAIDGISILKQLVD